MRIIITGLNGTVAPIVAERLAQEGHTAIAWDRTRVQIEDLAAVQAFFDREQPEWFFHIATGPAVWAETIATECSERGIGLLYTGSVSIFSDRQRGPLRPDATPDATDDYGRYKIDCEKRIRSRCANPLIVRLGWQIGTAPGGNNLVDYLHKTVDASDCLAVSRQWFPACSFLDDTAEALCTQFHTLPPGTYHLDANPGLSLYDIATRLNVLHNWNWTVVPLDEPVRHNLMEDNRLNVRPITERLAAAGE